MKQNSQEITTDYLLTDNCVLKTFASSKLTKTTGLVHEPVT